MLKLALVEMEIVDADRDLADLQTAKLARAETIALSRIARAARRRLKPVRLQHTRKERAEGRARVKARRQLHRKKAVH